VFLNLFAQHRAIHEILTIPHILTNRDIVVAYLPVGLLAVVRLVWDRNRLSHKEAFLLVSFAVSYLLATHDRFLPIAPIEPKHFTRGYVWMPLFLLSAPLLQRWLISVRDWLNGTAARPAAAVSPFRRVLAVLLLAAAAGPLVMLSAFDNLSFNFLLFGLDRNAVVNEGCFLRADARQALGWINAQGLDGVLLCPGDGMEVYQPHRMTSYLSASYTPLRPYIGHHLMTPHIQQRLRQVQDWVEGHGDHPWMGKIDYILADKKIKLPLLDRRQWQVIYENESLELMARKQRSADSDRESPGGA
jgi:hypothetical protein